MSHTPFGARSLAVATRRVLSTLEERIGIATLIAAVLLVGIQAAAAHELKVGELTIEHPWSRATPPGAKVGGGYLEIRNGGASADRLVSVSSPVAERSEIHEMAVTDGVMTMRPLPDGLEVPADGEVTLAPGGFHLMFVGLKRPLVEGQPFEATLTFEKAGAVSVTFSVAPIGASGGGHHMPEGQ